MIIALSGSSCSGKNTIIKELLKINNNLEYIKSCTSREKRSGETESNPYYFFSKDEFQNKIKLGDFFEYELIHNNFYGIEKNICEDLFKQKKSFIKDMGVVGTFNLKENITEHHVETIFLYVSKRQLKKRLINRGDTLEQIKLRLKRFKYEKDNIYRYNFLILNNNKENTVKIIDKILKNNKPCSEYIYLNNKNIKLNKIEKYKNKFINNKKFKPIKLYFNGEDFFINKGCEKFIASLLVNKNITKKVIVKEKGVLKTHFCLASNYIKELNLI